MGVNIKISLFSYNNKKFFIIIFIKIDEIILK
jgi:hypothetical protein